MRSIQSSSQTSRRNAAGLLAALFAMLWPMTAGAASTPWQPSEGAAVRLLTASRAAADGTLRGLLDISLEPGWKTYWRDPGAGGVPPSVDVSGSADVEAARIDFPLPERHEDDSGIWAGYDASVALPVTFKLRHPDRPARIEADVFLGVCQQICVPVSARLELETADGNPEDDAAVAAAYAALPGAPTASFGVASWANSESGLTLDVRAPGSAAPILFMSGLESGVAFGVPTETATGEGWRFAVPVLDRLGKTGGAPVFYTLSADGQAVSGTFPFP